MKADKKAVGRLLKTARGQIDGILEMIENDRYCVDISNQLLATRSILTKANQIVLKAHLQVCPNLAPRSDFNIIVRIHGPVVIT